MTFRQFEYVLAVAEEGSFTRAAQRLLVSQPALSHQVKALEQTVGGELFERLPGSVRLTDLGRAFLPHASAALDSAREANHAARAVGRLAAGELRVATLQSIALGIVPTAIQVWTRDHPRVPVRMHEFGHIDRLAAEMSHGVADVAIGPHPAGWDGEVRELGAETFMVILPSEDPLLRAGRRTVDLRRLADRPWVLYAPDFGLAPVVADACARAGFVPRAAVRAHHTATAIELAAAGLGPALVPSNVVGPDFVSCALRPEPPIQRRLVAFTRPTPAPAALAFIDVVAAHATL